MVDLTSAKARWWRLAPVMAATAVALGLLLGMLDALRAADARPPAADSARLYAPIVAGATMPTPRGSYDCLEYEFGLIWTSEVITLNSDGSSIYRYSPPYSSTVTGTWAYTPGTEEVRFTNFRWLTATYLAPDRLWSSRFLHDPGFEIALSCGRRFP